MTPEAWVQVLMQAPPRAAFVSVRKRILEDNSEETCQQLFGVSGASWEALWQRSIEEVCAAHPSRQGSAQDEAPKNSLDAVLALTRCRAQVLSLWEARLNQEEALSRTGWRAWARRLSWVLLLAATGWLLDVRSKHARLAAARRPTSNERPLPGREPIVRNGACFGLHRWSPCCPWPYSPVPKKPQSMWPAETTKMWID